MITDIKIVHNDPTFNISKLNFPYAVYVTDYYIGCREGKKKGWELKSNWGAKKDPFIICYEQDKPVKCFYTEADSNVYESLIKYLNE